MFSSRTTFPISIILCLLLLATLFGPVSVASPPWAAFAQSSAACPPLPPASGDVVHVSSLAELKNAVNTAASGATILVADGTYRFGSDDYLRFDVPDVTLRSASGYRDAVILDGEYQARELVQIVASNVTIADLSLQRARHHPIHVMSTDAGNTDNTRIYNVRIIDPGQQGIKINPHEARVHYPDNGLIACSHIELTDAGRAWVWTINGSCYTGGVDGHWARGWVVRDNLIQGFWCASGLSEHGVHMWRGCRDTLVERNLLRDNARGIGFGLATGGEGRTYPDNPCPGAGGGYVDHYGGIIRNNFVFASRGELFSSEAGFDCGICLWQACGAAVLHNTVASTQAPFSSIEWRFGNTQADIVNNLASHNLMARDGASASLASNLHNVPLSWFVDGPGGDLHLAATAADAIDQGTPVAPGACDDDIDGDTRPIGLARDIGADEHGVAPPAPVTDLRVTQALAGSQALTITLGWTAPAHAVTTTVRYSESLITEANWAGASPITGTLPGTAETLTETLPYAGGRLHFALKSQNAGGEWSGLSNNALWPTWDVYLPLVIKGSQ